MAPCTALFRLAKGFALELRWPRALPLEPAGGNDFPQTPSYGYMQFQSYNALIAGSRDGQSLAGVGGAHIWLDGFDNSHMIPHYWETASGALGSIVAETL